MTLTTTCSVLVLALPHVQYLYACTIALYTWLANYSKKNFSTQMERIQKDTRIIRVLISSLVITHAHTHICVFVTDWALMCVIIVCTRSIICDDIELYDKHVTIPSTCSAVNVIIKRFTDNLARSACCGD